MRPLKIGIVNQPWNPALPPVRTGSIAIWTYEVARRLAQVCETTVFAKRMPGRRPVEQHEGVTYRRLSTFPPPDGWLMRARRVLRRPNGLVPEFADKRYYEAYFARAARHGVELGCQIVHVHNLGQAVPIIRAANPGAAVVLHMHCEWLTQLPRECVSPWLSEASAIVGCSDHITRMIRAAWPEHAERCSTIHNGFDTSSFRPEGPARPLGRPGEKIILFAGRNTPEKGVHILIEAFKRVLDQFPNVSLVIVGPDSVTPKDFLVSISREPMVRALEAFYGGDYLSTLKRLIGRQAAARVSFVGAVPHDELPAYYRGAHVLVNPSLSESFGLTVAEAMACGLPPIVTRVGGMPEIVEDGRYGLCVAAGDSDGLAEAIMRLLADEPYRADLGRACARHARDCFSWERTSQGALALFRALRDECRPC